MVSVHVAFPTDEAWEPDGPAAHVFISSCIGLWPPSSSDSFPAVLAWVRPIV